MSVATFVTDPRNANPEEPIMFLCVECDKEIPATESDSHAVRKHKASTIRVFGTPGAYQDFLHEEKVRQAIKEMK